MLIIYLLIEDVLREKIVYTSYGANVYLTLGPRGNDLIKATVPFAKFAFPVKTKKIRKSNRGL